MRKEVLLAIIIGLLFGLVITYGFYRANQYSTPDNTATNQVLPSPSPETQISLFTLDSPTDGDIFFTPTATISGTLASDTVLTVLSEDDEFVLTSSPFIQEIPLIPGANTIQLIGLLPNGQRQELKLTLVYTTAKLD